MKARSSRPRPLDVHPEILELGILGLTGTQDGYDYCVRFESGGDEGYTPYQPSAQGSATFDHFAQLRGFDASHVLVQILQRDPGASEEGMPLFDKWVRVDLPPSLTSWKVSSVRLAGIVLTMRVMIDTVAISERPTSEAISSVRSAPRPIFSLPAAVVPLMSPKEDDSFERELVKPGKIEQFLKRFIVMFGGVPGMDGDGKGSDELSLDEFHEWLGMNHYDMATAKRYFCTIDKDDSGKLSRLEIIQFMWETMQNSAGPNRDSNMLRFQSVLCFMMFASHPNEISKHDGPVMTADDLSYLLSNLLYCTTYRHHSTRDRLSRNLAMEMLAKYSVKSYRDSNQIEHKYLRHEDFDQMIKDPNHPEYATILPMWRHVSRIDASMSKKAKDDACCDCCIT